jgi:hypothetical protein
VGDSRKGFHEICKTAHGKNLSLEILIILVLATSTQRKYCCELGTLIVSMAAVIVISHISGAIEDLHKLAHKRDG